MKILLLGDSDSVWMKRYVENVCLNDNNEIKIVSVRNKLFSEFYAKNNIKIVAPKHYINGVNKYNMLYYMLILLKKILVCFMWGRFDIIHIHYVTFESLLIARLVQNRKCKIVSSYWGSDLLRKPCAVLRQEEKYLKKSTCITLETEYMLKKFHDVYGRRYDTKIQQIIFGITGLDDIKNKKKSGITKESAKKSLNITSDKIVIAVGYNAIEAQQHLKALQSIGNLSCEMKNKLHIILQMTYGNLTDEYINKIKEKLKEINCTYTIFSNFLSDEEVAQIRIATDIFLHSQTTDSLSATIQESLYAGTIVINPTWIHYDILEKNEITYFQYSNWNQLEKLLNEILSNIERYKEKCIGNEEKMYNLAAWEKIARKWNEIYKR